MVLGRPFLFRFRTRFVGVSRLSLRCLWSDFLFFVALQGLACRAERYTFITIIGPRRHSVKLMQIGSSNMLRLLQSCLISDTMQAYISCEAAPADGACAISADGTLCT